MNFADIKHDTPQLVVMMPAPPSTAIPQWGVTPGLPLPHLIGYITRAHVNMVMGSDEGHNLPDTDKSISFVVAWDGEKFEWWWARRDVDVDALGGMLEGIKASLISGTLMQTATKQNRVQLYGADGRPIR